MKKINSRAKGRRGELEVCKLINNLCLGVEVKPNLSQPQSGGVDIIIPKYKVAIEVKRRSEGKITPKVIDEAFEQCCVAIATDKTLDGYIPVVFYRADREPWRVYMLAVLMARGGLTCPAGETGVWLGASIDYGIGDWFETWMKERLNAIAKAD